MYKCEICLEGGKKCAHVLWVTQSNFFNYQHIQLLCYFILVLKNLLTIYQTWWMKHCVWIAWLGGGRTGPSHDFLGSLAYRK